MITTTDAYISYTATGGETSYSFDLPFHDASEVLVYLNGTILSSPLDYTLSGTGAEGESSTLSFPITLGSGDVLLIIRVPEIAQEVKFRRSLNNLSLEEAFDRLTMIAQYLLRRQQNTIRFPDSENAGVVELAPASTRANKVLGFDANGDITYYDP